MAADSHVHDVVVVGASIAGATAAALLAAAERDVVLLEAAKFEDLGPETTVLSAQCRPILERAGVDASKLLCVPLSGCRFIHADFSKSAQPSMPKDAGFLADRGEVVRTLLAAAAAQPAVSLREGSKVTQLAAGEEDVSLKVGQEVVRGRIVVLATGPESELADQVGLVVRRTGGGLWSAAYRCPGGSLSAPGHVDYVLGLGSGEGLGYRLFQDGELTIGLSVQSSASRAIGDLMRMSTRGVEQGLIPGEWQVHAAGTGARWSPAAGALELETHIGKRIIAVGKVGGFVAGYTNESAFPEMWSADLACGTLAEALESKQPQDQLRDFDRVWRTTMAEYLRPPNTDPQSLLPLIFSNQQMADKMLESLLLGVNF